MNFELDNHLGNVLATVSDSAMQNTSDNTSVSYYTAGVPNANDYYAFGMVTPGRSFSAGTQYRYGFNGKEKSDEIVNDSYDYGSRIFGVKIGRWFSFDPSFKAYESPYSGLGNNPFFTGI